MDSLKNGKYDGLINTAALAATNKNANAVENYFVELVEMPVSTDFIKTWASLNSL